MAFTKYSGKNIRNFCKRVDKKGDDECWIWTGYKDKDGYGRFDHNGKSIRAHRVSLEMHLGREIRAGLLVCHQPLICHCRDCVNPRHLREDTLSANMLDMHIDGTMFKAKLTETQVREIRASKKTHRKLAVEYGVFHTTISRIISGRTWAHILPTKE